MRGDVSIRSVCLVKNEIDVIVETLTAAARWSDAIYVFDTGSSDGTWEAVVRLAESQRSVVPFRREDVPFDDGLRSVPFLHHRHAARPGDWWCRLDADEHYIDDPRTFLAAVPARHDTVWSANFQFYLTDEDVVRWREDPARYADGVPVADRCRWYVNNWSEVRFFRHRSDLQWDGTPLPRPLRRSHPERIRLKHYQYRSPRQVEQRFATRREAMARHIFAHELRVDWSASILAEPGRRRLDGDHLPVEWTERVLPAASLVRDDGEHYEITEALMPPIVDLQPTVLRRAARAARRRRRG